LRPVAQALGGMGLAMVQNSRILHQLQALDRIALFRRRIPVQNQTP
jgi:hypothetical protein